MLSWLEAEETWVETFTEASEIARVSEGSEPFDCR